MKDRETGTPDRAFVLPCTRLEVIWLEKITQAFIEETEGTLSQFPVDLSMEDAVRKTGVQKHLDNLKRQRQTFLDLLAGGDRDFLKNQRIYDELTEAYDLVEEEEAKVEIKKRLDEKPTNYVYRIPFSRVAAKDLITILDNILERYRKDVIPNAEKEDPTKCPFPFTKSYYVNARKREKALIEQLKIKVEKEL